MNYHFSFIWNTLVVNTLKTSLLLVILIWPVLIFSQTNWEVTSSNIDFFITNAGVEVDGTLGGFSADISFSPEALSESRINTTLRTSTIKTGISARDNNLKDEEYFHTSIHPTISMKSVSFRQSGADYIGTFDLTIKGVKKRVDMPFSFNESNGQATFSGSLTLDRLDFGVGESSWLLSDEVRIKILVKVNKS